MARSFERYTQCQSQPLSSSAAENKAKHGNDPRSYHILAKEFVDDGNGNLKGVGVNTGEEHLVGEGVTGSDLSDVSINGVLGFGGLPDDGLGLWEVTVEPLADAIYDITAEFEDCAGMSRFAPPRCRLKSTLWTPI